MGIVMAIFAVLAFDLYAARDPYNFGSFSRSFFSMFQVGPLLYTDNGTVMRRYSVHRRPRLWQLRRSTSMSRAGQGAVSPEALSQM